jgi:DNA polymerase bacteriophage-type
LAEYEDEDFGHIRWWDDYEITGKTEATRLKQIAAREERLVKLYDYCKTDVEVERLAEKNLYPLSTEEREVYLLDQRINDRGIAVDIETTKAALNLIHQAAERAEARIAEITQGKVTTLSQVQRLSQWLSENGCTLPSLDKQNIAEALRADYPQHIKEVLNLRQLGSKSSTKKLLAILNMASAEGRIQGNLLYHGATTGRFSGKGVQLQNLPRPEILDNPEDAIEYLRQGNLDLIEICFGPIQIVVADVIRSLFMAGPGKVLYAADFAAIEVRVLAWIAGQEDLLNDFRTGSDPYLSFGSKMYGYQLNKTDHPKQRQLSKGVVLGAGFQMGANKFVLTCEKQGMIISFEEAEKAIKSYRSIYKRISNFWYEIERAAVKAVKNPDRVVNFKRLRLKMRDGNLRLQLPSGRVLNYPSAKVVQSMTPWGEAREVVEISAQNPVTRKWERNIMTPGTWTENVVQAIARDLMVASMQRLEANGYPVVLTVHDEVVSEVDEGFGSVAEFESLVAATPDWAETLPVKAEGWTGKRYRK